MARRLSRTKVPPVATREQASLEASMTEEATILPRQHVDLLHAGGCSERTIDNYLYAPQGLHVLPR